MRRSIVARQWWIGAPLLAVIGLWLINRDTVDEWLHGIQAPLEWKDRRAIGSIFLARDNTGWTSNPRGWFGDPKIDVMSPAGIAQFKEDLLELADASILRLRATSAQGMIVWDLEGEEFPHPNASYVGDPTLLFRIAPEMDLIADEFFAKFTSAGFRVGLCVRPQKVLFDSEGRFTQHEYFLNNSAIHDELDRKIRYAQKRWRCSLFYVDSNFGVQNLGLYSASIFKQLQREHPDILLIPQHENRRYFGFTAPYYDFGGREKWPGTRSLADDHKAIYPNGFSVVNIADTDIAGHRPELVEAVGFGDILLYRTWFDSSELNFVPSIYREAKGVR
jgi:hypothetical protein